MVTMMAVKSVEGDGSSGIFLNEERGRGERRAEDESSARPVQSSPTQ